MVLEYRHEEHLSLCGALLDLLNDDGILDQRLHDKSHELEELVFVIVVRDALHIDVAHWLLALFGQLPNLLE